MPVAADGSEPILYPMRWVALAQYFLSFGGNMMQWVTFSFVVDQATQDFNMSSSQVNLLAALYEMVYIVAVLGTIPTFSRLGLRGAMRIASALNISGLLLRLVAALWWPSFVPLVIAQVLFAYAMTILQAAPPIVAARWFGESERTFATTIGTMANLFFALEQLIGPSIVTPQHHGKQQWVTLFLVLGAPLVADFVLCFFVVPSGPKTAPSRAEQRGSVCASVAASLSRDDQHDHAAAALVNPDAETPTGPIEDVAQLRAIGRIPGFGMLFFTSGLFFGGAWTIISLITQILKPFGFSEATVGWMGFCGTTIGAFASLPMGSWIDKKRVYREPLALALSIFSLTFFAIATVLYFDLSHSLVTVFALYVASGIAQSCCVPLFFEMCVELTYPYDETLATTSVMWAGNAFCVPLMYAVPAIIGNDPTPASGVSALAAVSIVSAVAAMLIGLSNPRYKRLEYEMSLQIPSA